MTASERIRQARDTLASMRKEDTPPVLTEPQRVLLTLTAQAVTDGTLTQWEREWLDEWVMRQSAAATREP